MGQVQPEGMEDTVDMEEMADTVDMAPVEEPVLALAEGIVKVLAKVPVATVEHLVTAGTPME